MITISRSRYWYIVLCVFISGIAFDAAWHNRAHLGWHTVWTVGAVLGFALLLAWRRAQHPKP